MTIVGRGHLFIVGREPRSWRRSAARAPLWLGWRKGPQLLFLRAATSRRRGALLFESFGLSDLIDR